MYYKKICYHLHTLNIWIPPYFYKQYTLLYIHFANIQNFIWIYLFNKHLISGKPIFGVRNDEAWKKNWM